MLAIRGSQATAAGWALLGKEVSIDMGDSTSLPIPIMVGQLSIRYLIDGSAAGGLGVFEMTVPPKSNVPPPHSHTGNEECVYVLAGTLRYSVNELVRDLRPGEWMFTPRGAVHQFSNPHRDAARALIILTPDIGAQFFRDVGAVVNVGRAPDLPKLREVMLKYGLAPAPPR